VPVNRTLDLYEVKIMRRISMRAITQESDQALKCSPNGIANSRPELFGHVRMQIEREESRDDLIALNAALERRNEDKIGWILAAAHDLLNKVNTVQALTELLPEDSGFQPSHKETVEAVLECTESMAHLLQDLQEIARAESAKPWLELTMASVVPVVEQSITLSRAAAGKKDIQLRFFRSRTIPLLPIDAPRLLQGFLSILKYFIKYCPAGGNIDVSVDRNATAILISVHAHGLVVPEEELRHMFTPFYRSRLHAVSCYGETFLGLAICKQVVEQHGGDIRAENNPDEGTCLHMTLPLPGCALSARTIESNGKKTWPRPQLQHRPPAS
jgi:signal transduction histidine kinase